MTTASEPRVWRIEAEEHAHRLERVRAELDRRGLGSLVVFGATRIAYLAGFFHIHTERPIVLVIGAGGETALLVPRVEQDHAEAVLPDMRLAVYEEYPGPGPHPMETLAWLIADLGLEDDPIACDHDGYHDVNGYEGPTLSEVMGATVVKARDLVDSMRMVKSEAELELLRRSAAWGDAAFLELRSSIRPGVTPREVGLEASIATMRLMTAELGPGYRPLSILLGSPVRAVVTAGGNTVYPHAFGGAGLLRRGDILIGYGHADVGGYIALQGRTLFMGEPDARCREFFAHAHTLFEATLEALRPSRRLSDVESEICGMYGELGIADWKRHHSGHGVGLQMHEPPFVDLGDHRELVPGMVLAIMPGLYVPGLGGFALADTVAITESGVERLNRLPYDLDWLTLSV